MSIIEELKRTMLIERLIGVGTYALLVYVFYNKISYSKSAYVVKKKLRFLTLVLSLMAFFYIPADTADLYRWRIIARNWQNMSFDSFYNAILKNKSTPIGYLLIFVCQKTQIDGLLPTVCALIFFYNIFYILRESYEDILQPIEKGCVKESNIIGVGFVFLMCSGRFLETISGVRCMVAFSIVAKSIYCEMIKGKNILKSIPLYLFACLLHTAAIPLVALRLFCLLFERRRVDWKTLLNILIIIFSIIYAFRYGENYISSSVNKANEFINSEMYSYSWEYIIAILQIILIIFLVYNYYKYYSDVKTKVHSIALFITLLSIIEIVLIRSYSIFHRFIGFSSFIIIPLLIYVIKKENETGRNACIRIIKPVSILILIIACTRGNLCAYKFFLI